MKKKQDFIEEMKNSQQFLSKLKGFQKASKDMKEKNKLVSHRNIWVKEFKYLARLERDADFDNSEYFGDFDRLFEYQIEDKQIFGRENYKSYSEMLKTTQQQFENYDHSVWEQLKSLPLLIQKTKEMNDKTKNSVNLSDIQDIINDIGNFLTEVQNKNSIDLDNIQRQSMLIPRSISQDQSEENQYMFLNTILGKLSDVKGFELEVQEKKRIQSGESHLKEYLEDFDDHLSPDEISEVIEQYQHATDLLNQTKQLEIQKISLDYQEALNLDESIVGHSQNFQKMQHIYNTYLGRGKLVTLYYERLTIQFPKINRKILERITEYIEAKIYKEKKNNAVNRNYWRERQQLLSKVEKQVNDRVEAKIKKAQREAEFLQRKQEKLKLEIELEKMRRQYALRKEEKEKIQKQEQMKRQQQQRKKDAIRRLYLDELGKKAVQVHEIKQKKKIEESQKQKRQREAQEREKKKLIEQNKPKIQKRQSLQKRKLQKKIEEIKAIKEQPIKKEKRINQAIEKYSFRPEIEPSEERLNAPTEAMIKKKETKYDKADKIELTKMTGYNINQLMSDMRYKLNTALMDAGLANTEYAREVLNKMSKRPE